MTRSTGPWIGFLTCAFLVVGLAGGFATYAAPLPLQRALAREATLDAVLTAPDSAARAALRPRLGDSAANVLAGGIDLRRAVALERARVRARFLAQAAAEGVRLRWIIALVTLTGAAFGAAILGAGRAPGSRL